MTTLTHFDDTGASHMVNVAQKEITLRVARAESFVRMLPETAALIQNRQLAKGDVLEVARLAGIMGAKRTGDLIPLCHPLGIDGVDVHLAFIDDCTLRIETRVTVHGRTGIEMEALTAATIAGLTVYDMCKAVDRGMELTGTRLLEKSGGKSGHYTAPPRGNSTR